MGSMIVEMDARIAAGEDFDLGVNANPYQVHSAAWRFYEDEHQALKDDEPVGVDNGPD